MKRDKSHGFDYYLTKEAVKEYKGKPIELRLQWLYWGNLLRKEYPEAIIKLHNKFREGKV